MLTREERRAAVFLAAVAAAGGVVRALRGRDAPPGAAVVAPELAAGDVERQAALARREAALMRPLGPGERIDLDRASAREIERLPRIGPSLALRIVEDRRAHGPFGSLEALDEVPGVGPALIGALAPHVRFTGPPRPRREVAQPERVAGGRRARSRPAAGPSRAP